jgi:hypothetical protein
MDPHREACRRHHRVIAYYCAHQAWLRGLDCILIRRSEMEKLLGIERFKGERLTWMREDFKPWFPHQEFYWRSGSPNTFSSVYFSRVDIEPHLPSGTMTDQQRVDRMDSTAPRTGLLFPKGRTAIPSIEEMATELALLGAGLKNPAPKKRHAVPRKKIAKKKVARKRL